MHITLLTVGSRGDVQPYAALGRGLLKAGYKVRLATHSNFQNFVEGLGLEFAPLAGDPYAALQSEVVQKKLHTGRNAMAFMQMFMKEGLPLLHQLNEDIRRACEGTEAVIYSTLAPGGYYVAKKMGIPRFAALLQPLSRTREFPSLFVPGWLRLGGRFNKLTHILGEQAYWQAMRTRHNRWLGESLGMAPVPLFGPYGELERERVPILYGFSPRVVPKPKDWAEWLQVCGYWVLQEDEGWEAPPRLREFLENGPPPVYIGFGSMPSQRPEKALEIALEALRRSGQRGLLLRGWGGLSNADLPEEAVMIDEAPHSWLLPRMAAVVHHGGAGTTAAGLRAGVPSILVPHFSDQPFWGDRVRALGVGPRPIPRKRLTAKRLAQAIEQALGDEGMRARAARLGEALRAEDGVGETVRVVERYLHGG